MNDLRRAGNGNANANANIPPALKRRPQMEDIAKLAGVATSTVSRALAGSPLVNPKTRDRIVELARHLNYAVNVGAQNLRLGQNKVVAVVVPYDPASRQHLSDPFFLALIGGIADALTESGHEMLLSRVPASDLEQAAYAVESGRAIGLILVGQWHHHDQLNTMFMRGVPFVVWGAHLEQQLYCTVGSDNVLGGELATAHLLRRGRRRVAFVGDTGLPEVAQRHQGYLRAHAGAGLAADPALLCPSPFVAEVIGGDVGRLLAAHAGIDGVFAASDVAAMAAIHALHQAGRSVPDQVAVVGYDDIDSAAFCHPALTTVRQPLDIAGKALVDSLFKILGGQRAAPVQLHTALLQRASA
ncbi:substrate-binding domain-containing protein [Rugamonas sp. DEMB1]|uniref:substrate-binding domain-containing protein n=1 Tax=Rugamonas sp. DEMB1 TaxID=3039386 RepID=UPI002448A3C5|nr:substrate-binding domain-containing protein [Rugamonas sp. DEMB1]WGG48247.1 substrate-binding domain-containing protein [Rugamonas sp. DEMB1]